MTTLAPPDPRALRSTPLAEGGERYSDAARETELDGRFAPGDEDRVVKDAMEIARVYFDANEPLWRRAVEHWRMYLGEKADPRSEEEKSWRSNIHSPQPLILMEAKVSVEHDIMMASRPFIQAEGTGAEDDAGQTVEKWLDYQLRGNKWRGKNPAMLRAIGIQGGEFLKLHYGAVEHTFKYIPNQSDYDSFRQACMDASAMLGNAIPMPNPVEDPRGFKVWQGLVNQTGKVKVPDPPFAGDKVVRRYVGPRHTRRSMFDIWTDPLVDDVGEQQAIFDRYVKSERWVRANAGPEPWALFDPVAVERALGESARGSEFGEKRFSKHRNDINDILGITERQYTDPLWDKPCEIFECYFAGEPLGEYPFVIILNGVVINKNPRQMPFMHGMVPLFNIRNLALPGLFHGVSDYQQLVEVFKEIDAFRNLRMDGAKIATYPILAKLASLAMPEMVRKLAPGMIIPVSRMDGISQLIKFNMPEAAYREPPEMIRDAQDAMAAGPNVQGQTATVGRIPATTDQGRMQQAVVRLKLTVGQIEEDLSDYPVQSLALEYEFGDAERRVKVGGKGSKDPYRTLSRPMVLEAIGQDWAFMASTNALDREKLAHDLVEFGKTYGANLLPTELRQIMSDVLEVIGTRNAAKIVSPEGTKDAETAYRLKKEQAIAASQQAAMQAKMGGVKVPSAVGSGEMAAVEAAAGGQQVAPTGDVGAEGGGSGPQ